MTLKAIFKWKHPDSTVDLNTRLQTLVPRGIFDGGDVSAGGGLTVNVTPFSAIGYDGMLVRDDATTNLSVQAGQTNYVVVRAKYVTGSTPTVQWQVLTQAAYNADADKNYLIVFAVVTVPSGATSIASSYISLLDRDAVDPMQRHTLRGVVATTALLPAHPPEQNREGDLYFVSAEQTIYYWDSAGSSWEILGSGAYNVETTSMADVVLQGERNRIENGSGVLGGVRPTGTTEYGFASDPDITIIETPSVANQIGFDTFSAIVNGHYVQPHARYVTMPAKPGTGTRYDLVFLEVWREAITVPESYDFERNPDGSLTYTITEISDKVETQQWTAGAGGDNFDVNELQVDDHSYVVTKYRLATIQDTGGGIPAATAALYDNEAAAPLASNIDGNNFVAVPGTDARLWMAAAAATSSDGQSWAIPLYVVKRTSAEDWTSPVGAIREFRDGVRFVFPVYAMADQNAARKSLDSFQRDEVAALDRTDPPYEKASGFLDSLDFSITNGTIDHSIQFYEDKARIRIRGFEDHLDFYGGPDLFVSYAPTTGYTRQMVYIKMSITLYADQTTLANTMVSTRHRPYLPSSTAAGSSLRGTGWKRGYVTYTVVSEDLGVTPSELDEHDAMTALGWSKGDLSLGSINKEYEDGGIWSKAIVIAGDDRIHPYLYEWAIPVCLVHRRNKATWHYDTNPNGTRSTRPDGRQDSAVIHADDLVDLRREVDVDPARLKSMLEQDIDKLMKGQLRTRMAEKWGGSGTGGAVAGSRILQTDFASIAGATGFPMPAVNATKKLWSDAREFVPVTESFDMDPTAGVYTGTYVTCNRATGAITITAPTGSHLCRHLPAVYVTDGDSSQATYLQYESDPLWSTREILDDRLGTGASPWPTAVEAKVVKGATDTETPLVYTNNGWTISASDTYSHATSMQNTIDYSAPFIAGDKCVVSFWVHYDRSITGTYVSNSGLSEIPDVVHKVERGPLSGTPKEVNVGTLYTQVRKTVAGATTTITVADVAAASGLSGTHTIVGVDPFTVEYSATPGAVISSYVMNNAQTQIVVTWAAPIAADVEFTLFFYTSDVDSWVEIGKGGKSVRGYYSWEDSKELDLGIGGPAAPYAFDIGTSIWHDAEVADRFVPMPQVWTNNSGLGAAWTLYLGPTGSTYTYGAGYQYSGLISITDPSGGSNPNTDQFWKFVYPKWDAPTANVVDELMVHYTYTPYQGLSSTGGLIATPATALTTLKNMTHGTVEENTDHYVTQSGACSVFGGVDGWTGWPARRPNHTLNFLSGRFGAYNQTQLVKETAAGGLSDFGYNANAVNLAPAAVQRLPFPMDNSMVTASYHEGTADFDLDPGREGVNAGYFSYAPAYPGLLPDYAVASGIRLDQFVNGLSRLAIPGEPKQQSQSRLVPAASFRGHEDSVTASAGVYDAQTCALDFAATETIYETAPIDVLQGHIVARTLTPVYNFRFETTPVGDNADKSGLHVLHPFADYVPVTAVVGTYDMHTLPDFLYSPDIETMPNGIEAVAASVPVYIGTAPGTILAYYGYSHISVAPILTIKIAANANGADRSVLQTLVTIESERQPYIGYLNVPAETAAEPSGPGIIYGGYTDLIRIPLGSNSLSTSSDDGVLSATGTLNSYGSSASSLRGRTIAYPSSWDATTIAAVEAHVQASELFYAAAYGRGVYLGSTTARKNMPVLVPGSGTALREVITEASLPTVAAQPPEAFPTAPTSSSFATSERRFVTTDHGGPLAYGFYGLMINPSASEFKGQAVMQITGGPTVGQGSGTGALYTSDTMDGTALDAFWPSRRPIVKKNG